MKRSKFDALRRTHRVLYFLLLIVAAGILSLPLILSLPMMSEYEKEFGADSFWWLPYMVGAVAVGVGLLSFFAKLFDEYFGHKITFSALIGGGLLAALSLFFLYH